MVIWDEMRARWESLVRDYPERARLQGPPNWLVKERTRAGESHMEAFARVKAEELGDNRPLPRTPKTVTALPIDNAPAVTVTEDVTEKVTRAPLTPAEKMRAYRERQRGGG